MENASKALLIAGGVLITIIIISVLVYVFNQFKSVPRTQEEVKQAEQLAEFNKKYESYNKKNMYGTDIITVINMARNNNETYRMDHNYQIEISVTVVDTIESRIRMWYYDTEEANSSKAVKEATIGWPRSALGTITSGTYTSSDSIWDSFLDPVLGQSQSEYVYSNSYGTQTFQTIQWYDNVFYNGKQYRVYYMTSNLAYEFKNKKFDCTGIEYGGNGRVIRMNFEQQ